jgi:hypothetical protein
MADTDEKLLEAEYFLKRMIEKQVERDTFKYNLSAFLSVFRSVTLIMQKEFKRRIGFADWYKVQQDKLRVDHKMKVLHKKRTMTIHIKPVRPHAHINVNITSRITPISHMSAVLIRTDGSKERVGSVAPAPSNQAETKSTVQWRWYFEDTPHIDVVTVCQECLEKLKVIVLECNQKFGSFN